MKSHDILRLAKTKKWMTDCFFMKIPSIPQMLFIYFEHFQKFKLNVGFDRVNGMPKNIRHRHCHRKFNRSGNCRKCQSSWNPGPSPVTHSRVFVVDFLATRRDVTWIIDSDSQSYSFAQERKPKQSKSKKTK